MLSNKQSIALTGFMVAGIFIFGVLDVLDNFMVLTVLTLVFFAIVINLIYTNFKSSDTSQQYNREQSFENK